MVIILNISSPKYTEFIHKKTKEKFERLSSCICVPYVGGVIDCNASQYKILKKRCSQEQSKFFRFCLTFPAHLSLAITKSCFQSSQVSSLTALDRAEINSEMDWREIWGPLWLSWSTGYRYKDINEDTQDITRLITQFLNWKEL